MAVIGPSSRRAAALLMALAVAACGGGGAGSPPSPPSPPVSPPPPPPPPPPFLGAVYAGSDHVGNSSGTDIPENYVLAYRSDAGGNLTLINSYQTGGIGSGGVPAPNRPRRINPLSSEDSLIAVDNRYLLVVNAGSNTVTSFRINSDFTLSRVDVEGSGGVMPISLAYWNGVVYVANADEDGTFTSPANQSGNITAMRLDSTTGELTPIAGFSLALRGRPGDLEVTPDGAFLLVSALNASSPLLPQPTARQVSSFRILADGALASTPAGTGQSTELNNSAGRNLPNTIGIETYAQGGRQFVIAAEARTVSSTGTPAATFASVQTGSVSTWEIAASGVLIPRSQDFRLGPSLTSGPLQAGYLAYSPVYSTFWATTSAGATISGYGLQTDGAIAQGETVASGGAVNPASPTPLAGADGFGDVAVSPGGRWLYQIVGLQGRIDVYEIDTLVAFNIARRHQIASGILPTDTLQGLAVVAPRTP
jgi:6-phosphogluconolactonase (cycloisomerase 2 family)